jgi:hypothetical protein
MEEVPRPQASLLALDEQPALAQEDEERLLVRLGVVEELLTGLEDGDVDPEPESSSRASGTESILAERSPLQVCQRPRSVRRSQAPDAPRSSAGLSPTRAGDSPFQPPTAVLGIAALTQKLDPFPDRAPCGERVDRDDLIRPTGAASRLRSLRTFGAGTNDVFEAVFRAMRAFAQTTAGLRGRLPGNTRALWEQQSRR